MEPRSSTIGTGARRAVVLSPVMAVWDGGASFGPVTDQLLRAGYRVTCYDTLSLLPAEGGEFTELVDGWAAVLEAAGPLDLIGGAALGGATALALLGRPRLRGTPAVLLSAPWRADRLLDQRLGEIAELAASNDLGAALALLERRAAAVDFVNQPKNVPSSAEGAARLAHGLPLLRGLDLSARPGPSGPLLHLYGERSQLVNAVHAVPDRPPQIRSLPVPGAGMRPQHDNPRFVTTAVTEFLKEVAA